MHTGFTGLLLIAPLNATYHSAKRTSDRYRQNAFSQAVYMNHPSAERRMIRKTTEPIGTLGRPSHPDVAAVWVFNVMLAWVAR